MRAEIWLLDSIREDGGREKEQREKDAGGLHRECGSDLMASLGFVGAIFARCSLILDVLPVLGRFNSPISRVLQKYHDEA